MHNALIKNHKEAVNQVITMVKEGKVHTQQGSDIRIVADTVCIHGDSENALDFAKYIFSALTESGIKVSKINEFIKEHLLNHIVYYKCLKMVIFMNIYLKFT